MTPRRSSPPWLAACCALLLSLCALAGVAVAAEEPRILVVDVRFEGNEQTRPEIMLQELSFEIGDRVSPRQIERSRQAIMDLGLFKRVTTALNETADGTEVTYIVEEKYYLLPIPLIGGDPYKGEWEYGIDLRLDNLQGLNQRVQVGYQAIQSTDPDTPLRRKAKVAFLYPRLLGSPYQFSMAANVENKEFAARDAADTKLAEYQQDAFNFGVGLSRWLVVEGPSAGWRGGMGLLFSNRRYDLLSGQAGLYEDSQAVSITANLGFSEVHDHGYYRTGQAYGWIGELGLPTFASDYSFNRNLFYLRNYRHYDSNDSNLNTQLRFGFANGHVFNENTYAIGGFQTLRGYKNSLEGNAFALANVEYLQQLDGWPSVRGVAFLDVGNAYPEIGDMNIERLEAGTGIGARWRVQSLVDVVVSFDLAYGIGPGETVVYLGTAAAF